MIEADTVAGLTNRPHPVTTRGPKEICMSSRSTVVCSVLALGAALVVGGCNSNTAAGRDARVRANLTPELSTLSQRPIEVDNRMTLSMDENLRLANEDLIRMWLLDRPSRLSRARVPR